MAIYEGLTGLAIKADPVKHLHRGSMAHIRAIKPKRRKDPLARILDACEEIQEMTGHIVVSAEMIIEGVHNVTLSNGDIYTVFKSGHYQKCQG